MATVLVEVSDLKIPDIIEKQTTAALNATTLNDLLDPAIGEADNLERLCRHDQGSGQL